MLTRFIFLWAIPFFLSTSAHAQPQDASLPAERTLWDHNGSMMYLVATGSSRELYYQKPRPGMLEAGAHPGDLLFKGQISDGQISGTAYIFNAQCGKVPFHVKGPILDNLGRIVLTGQAPRMGRNCQTYGDYASTLEFKLLKTAEITQPPSVMGQTPSAEEPTPAPSSDVGEPKLPDAAQPPPAKQTLTTEEPNPKVPSNAVSDTKPAGNRSVQVPLAAQPRSKQEPKSEAGEKEATTPSAPPSRTASAPASPQRSTEKNLLAPVIIALNGALPLLSILFLIMMLRSSASGVT